MSSCQLQKISKWIMLGEKSWERRGSDTRRLVLVSFLALHYILKKNKVTDKSYERNDIYGLFELVKLPILRPEIVQEDARVQLLSRDGLAQLICARIQRALMNERGKEVRGGERKSNYA